jgi:sigma-E factor negative regulatory protein RseA
MTHPNLPLPPDTQARQLLSALADGQAGDTGAQDASQLWRDDPAARQAWHTYQLIGDVMRSDELARPAAHDAAFLQRLRTRLAAEPVVLAPAAAALPAKAAATVPTPRWLVPVAAAAGLLLVAGVVLLNRPGAAEGDSRMARAVASAASPTAAPTVAPAAWPAAAGLQAAGQPDAVAVAVGAAPQAQGVIRSPQLDSRLQEYLRAHQSTRGGLVAAAPGGSLRRVDAVVTVGNGQ